MLLTSIALFLQMSLAKMHANCQLLKCLNLHATETKTNLLTIKAIYKLTFNVALEKAL